MSPATAAEGQYTVDGDFFVHPLPPWLVLFEPVLFEPVLFEPSVPLDPSFTGDSVGEGLVFPQEFSSG